MFKSKLSRAKCDGIVFPTRTGKSARFIIISIVAISLRTLILKAFSGHFASEALAPAQQYTFKAKQALAPSKP
jgi:hypothetical protein